MNSILIDRMNQHIGQWLFPSNTILSKFHFSFSCFHSFFGGSVNKCWERGRNARCYSTSIVQFSSSLSFQLFIFIFICSIFGGLINKWGVGQF